MTYKIYCDGASSNNGNDNSIGGWGFIIVNDKDEILFEKSGFEEKATNQKMELTGALKALNFFDKFLVDGPFNVTLYSDSAYFINCYKAKWYVNWEKNGYKNAKGETIANKELWINLIPFFKNNSFSFEKVKGHSNDYFNNYVDRLAVEAREKKEEVFNEKIDSQKNNNASVNHPSHYNEGKIEVIEYILDRNMNFCIGNAIKYLARAGFKYEDKYLEDLNKALWYLEKEVENPFNKNEIGNEKIAVKDFLEDRSLDDEIKKIITLLDNYLLKKECKYLKDGIEKLKNFLR